MMKGAHVNGSPWADAWRVDELKRLWATGLSASKIGERIGVTRNSVLSKVHRLGLPDRAQDEIFRHRTGGIAKRDVTFNRAKMPPVHSTAFKVEEPYVEPKEVVFVPPEKRKGVVDLEDSDCRWPIGDPMHADFHFCSHERVSGQSYCATHLAKAFAPPQPRKVQQANRTQTRANERVMETVDV